MGRIRQRYIAFMGAKPSIKRKIMRFSLLNMMILIVFGALLQVGLNGTARQYETILQTIIQIEQSQGDVTELLDTTQEFMRLQNAATYGQMQTEAQMLEGQLVMLQQIVYEKESYLAVAHACTLSQQLYQVMISFPLSGNENQFAHWFEIQELAEDVIYLLDHVESIEHSYATGLYTRLDNSVQVFTTVFLLMLLGMLGFAIWFSHAFTSTVYTPIEALMAETERIAKGEFLCKDLPILADDELGRLTMAVNVMKQDLTQVIAAKEAKLKAEKTVKETKLLALQSQINPHFLFNVLSLATESALQENADKTADIMEHIAYMMRYGLHSIHHNTYLNDELKMIKTYFFLQNARFGTRISFEVNLGKEVPNIRIPGMTLQPLVENAVVHGCECMEQGGYVKVRVEHHVQDGMVLAMVENNGATLTPDQMQQLKQGQPIAHKGTSTGLGLSNVRDRLFYYYDQPGLMDWEVVEGTVTRVTIKYPTSWR